MSNNEELAVIAADKIALQYHMLLGGDPKDFDEETAKRMFRFAKEFCSRRSYNKFTVFDSTSDEMIIGDELRFVSICEHHLLPFSGTVSIGYIPDGKIFGFSKLQRIVDSVASRPQLQEGLTKEIADFIIKLIQPKGVAVRVKATHSCVAHRGVNSPNAKLITISMNGVFRDNFNTRQEFLESIEK